MQKFFSKKVAFKIVYYWYKHNRKHFNKGIVHIIGAEIFEYFPLHPYIENFLSVAWLWKNYCLCFNLFFIKMSLYYYQHWKNTLWFNPKNNWRERSSPHLYCIHYDTNTVNLRFSVTSDHHYFYLKDFKQ